MRVRASVQYDASRGRVEAENYFELIQGTKLDLQAVGGGDGFAVGALRPGSLLRYPFVRNVPRAGQAGGSVELVLRVASPAAGVGGVGGEGGGETAAGAGVRLVVYNSSTLPAQGGRASRHRQRLGSCALPRAPGGGDLRAFFDLPCARFPSGAAGSVLHLALALELEGQLSTPAASAQGLAAAGTVVTDDSEELLRIDSWELR